MIPHIRKILYATDLSKNSSYAFYFAAEMAQKLRPTGVRWVFDDENLERTQGSAGLQRLGIG